MNRIHDVCLILSAAEFGLILWLFTDCLIGCSECGRICTLFLFAIHLATKFAKGGYKSFYL